MKTIEVDVFSTRYGATVEQVGYIQSLCRQIGITYEEAVESLFGMPLVAAFSDRPWLRLTRREASKLIEGLIEAQEDRREAHKNALADH